MKTVLLVLLPFFFTLSSLFSQEIIDISTKQDGEIISVFYTLVDNVEMQKRAYKVELYGIINRTDTVLLKEVDSDVGLVYAGEHYIRWNIRKEYERFRGRIAFEIRATPVFEITRPVEAMAPLKRGTGSFIKWYGGGSHNDSLTLELYKNDELFAIIDTVSDDNKYLWRIPPRTPVGKDFSIRIVGTEKTGIDEMSDYFGIRRKTPLWLQIVPGAVAGILGAIIIPPLIEPKPQPLPIAPIPGHN